MYMLQETTHLKACTCTEEYKFLYVCPPTTQKQRPDFSGSFVFTSYPFLKTFQINQVTMNFPHVQSQLIIQFILNYILS